MKANQKKIISLLVLITVLFFLLLSQSANLKMINHPGFISLTHVKVNALRISTRPSEGVRSAKFFSQVGGIAFEKIARPVDGSSVETISLQYNPGNEDGKRLNAIINGKEIIVPIPDWKLKPILLYADTEYYSCFSLFGSTGSQDKDENYKRQYKVKYLATYHPEFENTLVGLRLLQMDSVLTKLGDFHLLPKDSKGNTIFGSGEETIQRTTEVQDFKEKLLQLIIKQKDQYQSYVILDYPVDIEFFTFDGTLMLTGDLYIYFWKKQSEQYIKRVMNDTLQELLKKYKLRMGADGKIYGDNEEDIKKAQIEFEDIIDRSITLMLKTLSDEVYRNTILIQSINPVVYNCVRDVMRYAAFFRYCKIKNPDNFENIRNIISKVKIAPNILTPNGVK